MALTKVSPQMQSRDFDSVTSLLADTVLAYAGTGTEKAVAGKTVVTRSEGFSYTVAASGATDQHVTTAGGVKLYVADQHVIDAGAFNPPTTGDASAELQAAINLWVARLQAGSPCELKISDYYTIDVGLLVEFTSTSVGIGRLNMAGGLIKSNLTALGVAFEIRSRTEIRNINFVLNVEGSANDSITVLVDGGDRTALPKQYFYNCTFDGLNIEKAPRIGLKMTNNFFECQLNDPWIICQSTAVGTYACFLEDTASNSPSSIDIIGGSMRGGEHALYSTMSDCKVRGGTYIETGKECIYLKDGIGSGVDGVHVENAYQGTAGPNRAGVRLVNYGYARGVYGTSNNGNMDTVVDAFGGAGQGIDVSAARYAGGVTKALYVRSGSASVRAWGLTRASITFADTTAQRVTAVINQGRVLNATTSGTVTLNMDTQDWYDGTIVGNTTFAAPINGVAGDVIEVTLKQDGTGGRTVTWNAVFVVKGLLDATAGLRSTWRFRYTGGAWIEMSSSSGV